MRRESERNRPEEGEPFSRNLRWRQSGLLNAGQIQFYSCFISYSTANQDFADRLYADLQARGVRCRFARHDIRPGRKIHDQVYEAIRVYDRLLLILSKESMSSR
jgi:hypothetical protein